MKDKEDSLNYLETFKGLIVGQLVSTLVFPVLSAILLWQAKNPEGLQSRKAGAVTLSIILALSSLLSQIYVIKNYKYLIREGVINQTKGNHAYIYFTSIAFTVIILFIEIFIWAWYIGYPS